MSTLKTSKHNMCPHYYNVTFDTHDTQTVLVPRVPLSTALTEDKTMARICLCPTVEQCIAAIASENRNLYIGCDIVIREIASKDMDLDKFVDSDKLYLEGLVPDALDTGECWYCDTITVNRKVCTVEYFSYEHTINWNCLSYQQIIDCAMKYAKQSTWQGCDSPIQIYRAVTCMLEASKRYDESDTFWEDIINLPMAQGITIYNLRLIDKK